MAADLNPQRRAQADNVTDMYGAEFQLKYDPAMLAVQDAEPEKDGLQIAPGTLLPPNKGFIVANKVDEIEAGRALIGLAQLISPGSRHRDGD